MSQAPYEIRHGKAVAQIDREFRLAANAISDDMSDEEFEREMERLDAIRAAKKAEAFAAYQAEARAAGVVF